MYYIVKEPKIKKEKNPAIILIHGYGSNEEDLFSFADHLQEEAYVFSLRAPYEIDGFGFAWYAINFDAQMNKFSDHEQAKSSIDLIAKFIDEVNAKYSLSTISLIGFSQGSILSLALSFRYPNKVNNIIALSGYLNRDILPEIIDTIQIQKIKYFISHGIDDQVIPVDWARKTEPFFNQYQLSFEYKEYPVGHTVHPQNFWDFKNWLDEKL